MFLTALRFPKVFVIINILQHAFLLFSVIAPFLSIHTCAHTNTQSAFASQHKALARYFKAYCIFLTDFRCSHFIIASHFPFLKCLASTHLTFFQVLLWINSLSIVALQQPLLVTDTLQCIWPFSVGLVKAGA